MKDDLKPPKSTAANKPGIQASPKPAPTPMPNDKLDETVDIDENGNIDKPQLGTPKEAAAAKLGKMPPHKLLVAHIKHHWWNNWSRKQKILASVGAAIILVLIVGGVYALVHKDAGQIASRPAKAKIAKPVTVASPLSGVQVAPALAARPVTAIMIENSLDARPQSGLQDAGVVYEAIAEAGITRFMAFYQDTAPDYIGPVRSLRPYYIDFAAPYQASIVHVGGSPDAISEVTNGSFRNLDQFYNGDYFTRVSSRDAPHNVYTSFTQLDKLNQSKGYTTSPFTPWPRKADAKLKAPTAKSIDLSISSGDYHVHYDYDAASNSYLRSEGGADHMDLVSSSDTTGVQLKPKVVVALVMPLGQGELDASGAYYSDYTTSGSGVAYVFQDGGVTTGTWTKDGTEGQLQLTDSAGHALKLNAGQTWLTLVSATGQVAYTP